MVKKVAKKVVAKVAEKPVGFVLIDNAGSGLSSWTCWGYTFQLNGKPVAVNEVIAVKLRKHPSFKEV